MARSAAWERIGALSGIAFAVLVIIGFAVGIRQANDVVPSDVSGVIALNFGQTQDEIRLGAMIILAGIFFLFWFLALLHHRLREAEGGAGWLANVAYSGGLLTGAMLLVFASFGMAASVMKDYQGDWQVAKTLLTLSWDHLAVLVPALAAMVGGTAVVSIRSGALPAWLGWLSVLLVIAPVVVDPGLMAIVFLIWVIVVSVVLLYQTFGEPGPAPAEPGPD